MTFAFAFELLGALPKLLALLQSLADYVAVKQARGAGRQEAIAEALTIGATQLAEAAQVEREAAAAHAAHPTDDSGFDTTFQRKG